MRNIHMCVSHIIIFHGMFILFSHIFFAFFGCRCNRHPFFSASSFLVRLFNFFLSAAKSILCGLSDANNVIYDFLSLNRIVMDFEKW